MMEDNKSFIIKPFPVFKKVYKFPILQKLKFSRLLNIFKQLDPLEPQHSRIICDLIDPNNPNNEYASVFLKYFFNIVLKDNNFQDSPDDNWEVTAEKERFDIRIRNQDNSKIIIIENKSNWAGDQPNQLYRYWYLGIHQIQKDKKDNVNLYNKIIYLSPSENKKYDDQSKTRPKDPRVLNLTEYSQDQNLPEYLDKDPFIKDENKLIKIVYFQPTIVDWLDECINYLEKENKKANTYYYLLQYKDFWRDTMTEEMIKQVEMHFKDFQQWSIFNEWAKEIEQIKTALFRSLKDALNKCFRVDNVNDEWTFEPRGNNNWEYDWYLKEKEFDKDNLRIWLSQQSLALWINPNTLNLAKGKELLRTEKYSKINGAFERLDDPPLNELNPTVSIEVGNFKFNDTDNGHISPEEFTWYCHYETDLVVKQILRKINRFREPEVTNLIKKLIKEIPK